MPAPVVFPARNPIAARAVARAGLTLWQHDGVWLTDDDPAVVQAVLDNHDPAPELRAELVEQTKAEARRRILAIAPEWRQVNAVARAVELMNRRQLVGLAPGEEQETEALVALWDTIKAIRAASDRIEAAIAASTDIAELAACDVAASPEWPGEKPSR